MAKKPPPRPPPQVRDAGRVKLAAASQYFHRKKPDKDKKKGK
jgi:hypothetical protein